MSDLQPNGDHRHGRERGRSGGVALGALVLIGIGVFFLVRNLGSPLPRNWWAVFLLVPIVVVFGNAWRAFRRAARPTRELAWSLMIGILLIALAVALLLDIRLDWNLLWPVILIVVGLAALARPRRRS